jgi:hypothetical protein
MTNTYEIAGTDQVAATLPTAILEFTDADAAEAEVSAR